MSIDLANAAFQRFAEALNHSRDVAQLRAAVIDEVRIDRHAPHPPGDRGVAPIAESFAGIAEVERWFARMPVVVRFSLAGAARPAPDEPGEPGGPGGPGGGDRWAIEYAYVAADFHHGGIWLAQLAGDGRIALLSHRPFALRDPPPGSPHSHGHAHDR